MRLHHDHGARLRIRSLDGGRRASLLPEAEGARPVHWSVGPTSVSANLGDRRFLTEGEWRQKLAGGTRGTVETLARELRDALRA